MSICFGGEFLVGFAHISSSLSWLKGHDYLFGIMVKFLLGCEYSLCNCSGTWEPFHLFYVHFLGNCCIRNRDHAAVQARLASAS